MLSVLRTCCKCLIAGVVFVALGDPLWAATQLKDEGTSQGYINKIDCVGAGIACTRSGITGTVTVGGGGSGDITDVFSCATGDCSSITVAAMDLLDFSGSDSSATNEGIILPQHATACAGGTAEGQLCWEADADILHIGDSTGLKDFISTSAFSGDAVVSTVGAVTIQANSVALTTDTTGNYAAGDAEAGNALTGDSATAFFSAGTIEHERGGLEANISAYDGLIGITGGATYNQTGTTTQIIIFDGAGAPTSAALSGDATMTNGGVVTVVDDSHNHVTTNIDAADSATWAAQITDEDGSGECGAGLFCMGGHTHAGGADTNAVKELYWPAAALLPLQAADSIPPIVKEEGTNSDHLVVGYDDGTDECRFVTFQVPSDADTSGNSATFRIHWYPATASTSEAVWDVRWHEVDDGESWDGALTTESSDASNCAGTAVQDVIDDCSWTETFANLGWVANDIVQMQVCRDADNANDALSGDAYMISFAVEMPRA